MTTVSLINRFTFLFASISASAYRRDGDIQGYIRSKSATQEAEPEHQLNRGARGGSSILHTN